MIVLRSRCRERAGNRGNRKPRAWRYRGCWRSTTEWLATSNACEEGRDERRVEKTEGPQCMLFKLSCHNYNNDNKRSLEKKGGVNGL